MMSKNVKPKTSNDHSIGNKSKLEDIPYPGSLFWQEDSSRKTAIIRVDFS